MLIDRGLKLFESTFFKNKVELYPHKICFCIYSTEKQNYKIFCTKVNEICRIYTSA